MKTLMIAKRAAKLLAYQALDFKDIMLKSGWEGIQQHKPEIHSMGFGSDSYLEDGILLTLVVHLGTMYLGHKVNVVVNKGIHRLSPTAAKEHDIYKNISIAIALSNVAMSAGKAIKVRYNSPEFKARRACRELFGANITVINL